MAGSGNEQITLDDASVKAELPAAEYKLLVSDDLGAVLDPPSSGGLLSALHLWRRLLMLGPQRFGQVYYLGTAPIQHPDKPEPQLVDVLVGVEGGVECHFLVDPAEGFLLGMEMFPDDEVDPCELYFSRYAETDGKFLPQQIAVRYGNDLYGVLELSEFQIPAGPPQPDSAPPEPKE